MASWGKTDTLADQPLYVSRIAYFDSTAVNTTANTINILSSNTGFATGDAVQYSINGGTVIGGLTDATTYYVRNVGAGLIELYDTYANAINLAATTGRLDIMGAGVGRQTFKRVGNIANSFADHNYNGQQVLFVDREESQQKQNRDRGLVSPGWWLYRTWTNADSSVQHNAELLVAMDVPNAVSGDASDDAIVVDFTITITEQPADQTVDALTDATFAVDFTEVSGTVDIQWQSSTDGTTWNDITDATGFDLTIVTTDPLFVDGNEFRAVLTGGGSTVTSNAALLTVTA